MREINCPLFEASNRWPDHPALIANDTIVTYREYNQQVDTVVLALQREGMREADIVGILAENSLAYAVLVHALWRLGAVACPVSTRLPTDSVAAMLDDIGCGMLVTTSDRISDSYPASILQFDLQGLTASDVSVGYAEQKPFKADLDRAATVIFTSGTTDKPKAVLHSFGNHYYSALGSNENIRVLPGDRWLLSLPLYHVGGLAILFRVLLGGGTVVLDFGDDQLSKVVERCQITHLSLVATQLRRLLQDDLSPATVEWLKAILVGGGTVPDQLITEAVQRGWPIFTTYGLTEMASQVTTSAPNDSLEQLATSGRLLKDRQMRIADDGEILVRGETLLKRYFGTGDAGQLRDSEGWFHTGDTGSLDDDGYLTVIGRKDNMFVSGGENIHPEEIERCLDAIFEVEESLVVGQPDEEFGYRPVAFIRFAPGKALDRAEILTSLKDRLPGFKLPVRFLQWPILDGSESIKPSRSRFLNLALGDDAAEIN